MSSSPLSRTQPAATSSTMGSTAITAVSTERSEKEAKEKALTEVFARATPVSTSSAPSPSPLDAVLQAFGDRFAKPPETAKPLEVTLRWEFKPVTALPLTLQDRLFEIRVKALIKHLNTLLGTEITQEELGFLTLEQLIQFSYVALLNHLFNHDPESPASREEFAFYVNELIDLIDFVFGIIAEKKWEYVNNEAFLNTFMALAKSRGQDPTLYQSFLGDLFKVHQFKESLQKQIGKPGQATERTIFILNETIFQFKYMVTCLFIREGTMLRSAHKEAVRHCGNGPGLDPKKMKMSRQECVETMQVGKRTHSTFTKKYQKVINHFFKGICNGYNQLHPSLKRVHSQPFANSKLALHQTFSSARWLQGIFPVYKTRLDRIMGEIQQERESITYLPLKRWHAEVFHPITRFQHFDSATLSVGLRQIMCSTLIPMLESSFQNISQSAAPINLDDLLDAEFPDAGSETAIEMEDWEEETERKQEKSTEVKKSISTAQASAVAVKMPVITIADTSKALSPAQLFSGIVDLTRKSYGISDLTTPSAILGAKMPKVEIAEYDHVFALERLQRELVRWEQLVSPEANPALLEPVASLIFRQVSLSIEPAVVRELTRLRAPLIHRLSHSLETLSIRVDNLLCQHNDSGWNVFRFPFTCSLPEALPMSHQFMIQFGKGRNEKIVNDLAKTLPEWIQCDVALQLEIFRKTYPEKVELAAQMEAVLKRLMSGERAVAAKETPKHPLSESQQKRLNQSREVLEALLKHVSQWTISDLSGLSHREQTKILTLNDTEKCLRQLMGVIHTILQLHQAKDLADHYLEFLSLTKLFVEHLGRYQILSAGINLMRLWEMGEDLHKIKFYIPFFGDALKENQMTVLKRLDIPDIQHPFRCFNQSTSATISPYMVEWNAIHAVSNTAAQYGDDVTVPGVDQKPTHKMQTQVVDLVEKLSQFVNALTLSQLSKKPGTNS